ncbi:hypothetical protein MAA5396_05060 [Marinovum algicola]|uniref:Rad50/SbcC-type AAA domain-containing protein n=1 Tax=Marinovum algicola TaxID=42444 RepID=A0A975WFQ0_9RHOB|nr:hypothetical protein [Marinovum algicola]SEK12030.1 hypothetical protein SAMN04487940_1464 [Marinovum algicola]SLN77627.1 hypothetical protein MAA5396_05060 [Marinovum algicola]
MTLRFRKLRLRAITSDGVYGTDISFSEGLTVLWADNTKGKSTCMQGMIYALGLERMLSPRREIPLPHAMTTYLNTDDDKRVEVLESSVSLELSNNNDQIITVNRAVKASTDKRLVTVDFGAALTNEETGLRRQNFFVHDPGAAQREDGFHHFLESFIGWHLPQVRRYDAPDTKLYLETVFPLFWVEQKFGWSAIPAAIPTYMRIREVHKRAVEFILDLDVYKLEAERERLSERLAANSKDWSVVRQELELTVSKYGGRVSKLSDKPIADPETLSHVRIELIEDGERLPLDSVISHLRGVISEMAENLVPDVKDQAGEVAQRLERYIRLTDELNAEKLRIHGIQQIKSADIRSLKRRIIALENDLAKNLDVQKLQKYSGVSEILTPDRCPTCEQALVDALVSQDSLSSVMPISENVEYIRAQKKMFESILAREQAEEEERRDNVSSIRQKLSDYYSQIRSLRSELIAPDAMPSAATIEQRLRAEARLKDLESLMTTFEEAMERFESLQVAYREILLDMSKTPKEKLSQSDKEKLVCLTDLMRDHVRDFDFTTFPPSELSISQDSYKPEKEGFEIGFETSASDAIRLKWAYQLGLLELASVKPTNHPGALIFDEPRQQSSSRPSFENLLHRAAQAKARDQQVIFSTSENLETLRSITSSIDCSEVIFPGYILQRLE